MIKKSSIATALVLAAVALPSQAALLATWDVAAVVSGSTEVIDGVDVHVIGSGSGGIATLDSDGTFAFSGLVMDVDADAGLVGGAIAVVGARGAINGTYDSGTQQLSNNMAGIVLSEISACDPYGLLGSVVCGQVPKLLKYDQTMVLSPDSGLTDPITFDLVNDFSFLVGNLGGVAALEMTLTNVVLETPVPAAAWLFGSALMGLAGIKRRK